MDSVEQRALPTACTAGSAGWFLAALDKVTPLTIEHGQVYWVTAVFDGLLTYLTNCTISGPEDKRKGCCMAGVE